MPYPKKLLNDSETVALDLHPHWWHFARPAAILVLAIVVGIAVFTLTDGTLGQVLGWAALAFVVGSAHWLVKSYAEWSTTNFVVTNHRVIYRSGVFAKDGIEIPLDRVNNVMSSQGFVERVLGAGDVMIESGGETGQQRFSDIKGPERVQKLIHAQKQALFESTRSTESTTDVASQLEKLEGLLHRGTISQEDFDSQKRRLLEG